jgi:hypothetical protein
VSEGSPPQAVRRLIAVCRADPAGRYDWLPPSRPGDAVVALDGLAHADLAERRPLLFDELESWDERSAAERSIAELLTAVAEHPAVAAIERRGYSLIDFAELRLRSELTNLLRGWKIARVGAGAHELVCDPGAPQALAMGVRAGLGLDPAGTPYTIPPALPGSRLQRALARPLMRALAAGSRPECVRIAAVAAGKLWLALASLSAAELRAAGVGAMPFPGLDYGNGALLALRRRIPLLATYGPCRSTPGPAVRLPNRLELGETAELDRAITILVARLLAGAAPELEHALGALACLRRARALRALVLPSAAYGASRLLIRWAHDRGLRVGAMQHGIYVFREFDGGDRLADLIFGWGEGTVEQTDCWPDPRPEVLTVGVPGTTRPPACSLSGRADPAIFKVNRALIATSSTVDTPIMPAAFCEAFLDVLTPGLRRLAAAGVQLDLRPHPNEDAQRYRRLLKAHRLDVRIVPGGPFSAAAADADILISSTSSVAFEAGALGLPVLLWLGGAPSKVRREHLVAPWTEHEAGMFEDATDFGSLADSLLEHPVQTLRVAEALGRRLAHYAGPFDRARFAAGLNCLAE